MASELLELADGAVIEIDALLKEARSQLRVRTTHNNGKVDVERLERHQHAAHSLAWLATYVLAVRELIAVAKRLESEKRLTDIEFLLTRIGVGEYLDQIFSGIAISQGEIARPSSLFVSRDQLARYRSASIETLINYGNTAANREELVEHMRQSSGCLTVGDAGLDEELEAIRSEMHRFGQAEVVPHAHQWHLNNDYIPLEIVERMAELGVAGLTIPEPYGGMGLSKVSMCVVSEELSRAYLGVGSLGTRSEMAAELILGGGTEDQRDASFPG